MYTRDPDKTLRLRICVCVCGFLINERIQFICNFNLNNCSLPLVLQTCGSSAVYSVILTGESILLSDCS